MAVSTEASRSDCSVLNVTLDSDNETNTVCVRTSARENKVTYPSPASTWVSVGSVISSGSVENAQDSNYCMNGTNNNHGEQRILITTNVGSENHNVTSDDNIYEGIGPCIPPGVMITSCSDQEDSSGDIDMEPFGPLPPPPSLNVSDDDNSDFGKDVGPLPFHGECDSAALEYAHLRMQLESKEDESMPKREEWMLKVPKKSVMSKLDARQFKRGSSVNTDFDASWEEIHHAKKFRIEDNTGANILVDDHIRDDEQRKILEAFDVERQRLVHVPQKAENTKIKCERVPFDRERDIGESSKAKLNLNEVKRRIGKLDSRFASGSGQKFL